MQNLVPLLFTTQKSCKEGVWVAVEKRKEADRQSEFGHTASILTKKKGCHDEILEC